VAVRERDLPDGLIANAFARIVREGTGLFGGRVAQAVERTRSIRRPHSILVWTLVRFADGSEESVVVKVPRHRIGSSDADLEKQRRRLRSEYETAVTLQALLHDVGGVATVDPVGYFEDIPALVTRAVPGESLREQIMRRARWRPARSKLDALEESCVSAGAWLRRFQDATARSGEEFALEPFVAYVQLRVDRLVALRAGGMNRRLGDRVHSYLLSESEAVTPEERRVSALHADFSLSNILWNSGRIVVVDIPDLRNGSVLHDASRLYHQIGLLRHHPAYLATTVRRLQTSFLRGYGGENASFGTLFRMYLMRHTVCHWLGRLRSPAQSLRERLYNRWVCRGHRLEVERLLKGGAV